jgi:hypothetical protein
MSVEAFWEVFTLGCLIFHNLRNVNLLKYFFLFYQIFFSALLLMTVIMTKSMFIMTAPATITMYIVTVPDLLEQFTASS